MYQNKTNRLLIMAASVALISGCGKQTLPSVDPDPPTVDDYPALTNQQTVTITGQRSANTTIWYQKTGESAAVRGAAASPDTTWTLQLPLNEGTNKVAITASNQDETLFSDAVEITIELDTIPPSPPTVEDPPNNLSIGDSDSQTITLRGTKDPASSLVLNGTTQVPVDESTTWQANVELVLGINSFEFRSADLAGNVSGATKVEIIAIGGSGVVSEPWFAPELDDKTNVSSLTITGRKAEGTSVWLEHQGVSPAAEIMAVSDETAWSHEVVLVEGENTFLIYSANSDGAQSTVASDAIILDTIAPNPPALNPVDASTGQSDLTVTGSRDSDGNVCFRRGVDPTCIEIESRDASSTDFSYTLALNDGDNFLCFSSSDDIGNSSEEVCVSIVKLIGPSVTIDAPDDGAVVSAATVPVTATAVGTSDPGGNVASVSICLNAGQATETCDNSPSATGNSYGTTFSTTGLANGSLHIISVTATNGVGVETTVTSQFIYQDGVLLISDTGSAGEARDPSITEDQDGTLHVVWVDDCMQYSDACLASQPGNTGPDILHRSFGPSGWSDFTLVSDTAGGTIPDGKADYVTSVIDTNGLLHIIWTDNGITDETTVYDLYHRTLDPQTNVMSAIDVVHDFAENVGSPYLVAGDDGSVHLVWKRMMTSTNGDIYYSAWSAEAGWGDALLITDHERDGNSAAPKMALDSSGNPHFVWQDNGGIVNEDNIDEDVYYRSLIGGSLTPYVLISNQPLDDALHNNGYISDSLAPSIAIGANDWVWVVWADQAPVFGFDLDRDIFIKPLYNGVPLHPSDSYLELAINGMTSNYSSESPVVKMLDSGELLIVWLELNANNTSDVAYSILSNNTADPDNYIWTPSMGIQLASSTENEAFPPSMAVGSNGTIHLVWADNTTLPGIDDALAAEALADGSTTLTPDKDIFYLAITP